jgi:hypothetical protein
MAVAMNDIVGYLPSNCELGAIGLGDVAVVSVAGIVISHHLTRQRRPIVSSSASMNATRRGGRESLK